MIVEVEITPNPETLKFLPGKKVSEIGPIEFLKAEEKIDIPLAKKILSLDGINMIFFGTDFITVKKEKNYTWEDLKYGIIAEINDFYSNYNMFMPMRYKNVLGKLYYSKSFIVSLLIDDKTLSLRI